MGYTYYLSDEIPGYILRVDKTEGREFNFWCHRREEWMSCRYRGQKIKMVGRKEKHPLGFTEMDCYFVYAITTNSDKESRPAVSLSEIAELVSGETESTICDYFFTDYFVNDEQLRDDILRYSEDYINIIIEMRKKIDHIIKSKKSEDQPWSGTFNYCSLCKKTCFDDGFRQRDHNKSSMEHLSGEEVII